MIYGLYYYRLPTHLLLIHLVLSKSKPLKSYVVFHFMSRSSYIPYTDTPNLIPNTQLNNYNIQYTYTKIKYLSPVVSYHHIVYYLDLGIVLFGRR